MEEKEKTYTYIKDMLSSMLEKNMKKRLLFFRIHYDTRENLKECHDKMVDNCGKKRLMGILNTRGEDFKNIPKDEGKLKRAVKKDTEYVSIHNMLWEIKENVHKLDEESLSSLAAELLKL